MYRWKQRPKPAKSLEYEDSICDTFYQVTTDGTKGTNVEYHFYDTFSKAWLRRHSRSQPYIRLVWLRQIYLPELDAMLSVYRHKHISSMCNYIRKSSYFLDWNQLGPFYWFLWSHKIACIRQNLPMNIREDYNHLGFSLRVPQAQSIISALTDTGCQSCLAGLKVVGYSVKGCKQQHSKLIWTGQKGGTRQMVYLTDVQYRQAIPR